MTRIIAVSSGKGGVGKTTISANLGIAISLLGKEVVILDLDIKMANLELVLGLEGKPVTLQDVLSGRDTIYNAIYEGPGGIRVVPTGLTLLNLRNVNLERLEEVLEILLEDTDVLILDTPGGLEQDALTAMEVADEMILVTTPEITSLSDTLKTEIMAEKIGIKLLGVVVNRQQQSNEDFLSVREIETILDVPVISVIPEDPELNKASAFGYSLVIDAPNSNTSNTIMHLGAEIVGEEYQFDTYETKGVVSRFLGGILSKYISI